MVCILKQDDLYTRTRCGAIVLAAGQGSRMGDVPKSLIELQGVPLINRQLIALSGAGVDEVVVVTGYYHDLVESAVEQFPVKVVRNPKPERGQASSVRLGMEALGSNFDAIVMALSDQPLINTSDVTKLITAFQKRLTGEFIMPVVNGQRGNPIVLSGAIMAKMLDSEQNMVCRKFMDQHPELVSHYETDNDHFIFDVDRLEDLKTFTEKTGSILSLPKHAD
jgi:CTP:molybdopterin cytidylyltransferase MocA